MNDLIKALQILAKYAENDYAPTHCEHDVLYVTCVKPERVASSDIAELENLGFSPYEYGFQSYRFGSS